MSPADGEAEEQLNAKRYARRAVSPCAGCIFRANRLPFPHKIGIVVSVAKISGPRFLRREQRGRGACNTHREVCTMKVVLKQDVKSIGKKDELHEVSDGYARNYLLPRGLAVAADAAAVNEVRTKAAASEHHAAEELANAQALAKKLNGQIVAIKAKAGQGGRLFGSVTSKDIAAALTQKVGEPVDKRKIVLDGDIKNFGSYEVEVKVYPKVTAKLTVKVEE